MEGPPGPTMRALFAALATASYIGLYLLRDDYKTPHHSLSQQMDGRIIALEKRLKEIENSKPVEAAD